MRRMGNLMVRLHIRLRLMVVLFFALSFVLLWFVRSNSCRSYITTWGGMLPLQARPSFCHLPRCAVLCPAGLLSCCAVLCGGVLLGAVQSAAGDGTCCVMCCRILCRKYWTDPSHHTSAARVHGSPIYCMAHPWKHVL